MRYLAVAILGLGAATSLVSPVHAWSLPARGQWPTYLADAGRSGFAWRESVITPRTVGSLRAGWRLRAGGSVSGQAVVAAGRVYWGSWDGLEHATTIGGDAVWSVDLGTSTDTCDHATVGVAGTATVSGVQIGGKSTSVIFVGGGDTKVYALMASTGAVLWKRRLGPPGAGFVWSSPLVHNGSIFIGLASESDCPLVQGKLFKLNAATGAVEAVLNTVPAGCTGGSIWSSPTLAATRGTIYVTTGNDGECSRPEPLAEAMVEVRASDLAVLGSWAIPGRARVPDSDFGATATLFTGKRSTFNVQRSTQTTRVARYAVWLPHKRSTFNVQRSMQTTRASGYSVPYSSRSGRFPEVGNGGLRAAQAGVRVALVGAVNKNGTYYAFRRDNIGAGPVWQAKIGWGGSNPEAGRGEIATSAFAAGQLFVAGGTAWVKGTICLGTLSALDPATGAFEWQDCLGAPVLGAVTMARGLVFVSCGSHIMGVSSANGKVLLDRFVRGGAFEGPPSIAAGVLYQGDMNGRLLALWP